MRSCAANAIQKALPLHTCTRPNDGLTLGNLQLNIFTKDLGA